jgi:hypothetical protein
MNPALSGGYSLIYPRTFRIFCSLVLIHGPSQVFNSTKYPIPSFVKKYSSFVHPSGFMASFSKREDALKFVLEMEKRKLE